RWKGDGALMATTRAAIPSNLHKLATVVSNGHTRLRLSRRDSFGVGLSRGHTPRGRAPRMEDIKMDTRSLCLTGLLGAVIAGGAIAQQPARPGQAPGAGRAVAPATVTVAVRGEEARI